MKNEKICLKLTLTKFQMILLDEALTDALGNAWHQATRFLAQKNIERSSYWEARANAYEEFIALYKKAYDKEEKSDDWP